MRTNGSAMAHPEIKAILELRYDDCPKCKRPLDEIIHNAAEIIAAGGTYCPLCYRAWDNGAKE